MESGTGLHMEGKASPRSDCLELCFLSPYSLTLKVNSLIPGHLPPLLLFILPFPPPSHSSQPKGPGCSLYKYLRIYLFPFQGNPSAIPTGMEASEPTGWRSCSLLFPKLCHKCLARTHLTDEKTEVQRDT